MKKKNWVKLTFSNTGIVSNSFQTLTLEILFSSMIWNVHPTTICNINILEINVQHWENSKINYGIYSHIMDFNTATNNASKAFNSIGKCKRIMKM